MKAAQAGTAWAGEFKNPGAAVAAPGLEAQQPNHYATVFAGAQTAALKASLIAR